MDAVKLKPQRRDLITKELARHPVGSAINVGLDPVNPGPSMAPHQASAVREG